MRSDLLCRTAAAVFAAFCLLIPFLHSQEQDQGYTWAVHADGMEGTLLLSADSDGGVVGSLAGAPVRGFLNGRKLVLQRKTSDGKVELWEGWLGTNPSGAGPMIAGWFLVEGGNQPRPWYATPLEEGEAAPSSRETPSPRHSSPSTPPTQLKVRKPETVTATKRQTSSEPEGLTGTWQTPDGPVRIVQQGKKLSFFLPDRVVSGRLLGEERLIGGFGVGCCKGTLKEWGRVIRWDNGVKWRKIDNDSENR